MRSIKRLRRKNKRLLFSTILVSLVLVIIFVLSFVLYLAIIIRRLPSPESFGARQINESSKIYDRTGEVLLYEIHGEEKRTIVPFGEIPDYLKWVTLAAENANFYNEPAFDIKSILRALLVNLRSGEIVQGGSTITQQLAKNVFLTPERTVTRKLKELVLAIELESRYTKDQIFEFYLNQIPYGSNAYGVEAASLTFFNKPVKSVSLGEAAILAALPKAPSYYSPWGNHKEELFSRQKRLLEKVVELGFVDEKTAKTALAEKIDFAPPSLGTIKAPHFSLAVKDYLVNQYGEDVVLNGGLKIITTLNWEMQQIAEEAVKEGALRNEELYNGKNAALVAEDPKTGQVLSLVGSRDYFDIEREGNFNVATQGLRQPGSALKPFAYLTAFEKGYSPKTVVFDAETEFDTTGDPEKSYKPHNFGDLFRGPVTLEAGLAQSINIPSVKVLYLAGLDETLKNAEKFGITSLKERWRYGLSLILGGGEVRLVDIVNAYATLSQEGLYHKQKLVLEVKDGKGRILESYKDEPVRVMDPQSPRLINQILSDKELRSFLLQNSLSLTLFPEREVALKTGTTNDYRDAWAIGYTPSLVVGVWAGNNDNAPMQRQGSSILAAIPIWSAFLRGVLEEYPKEVFEKPDLPPIVSKTMLNGQFQYLPTIQGKTYPQIHSILYYVNPKDPLGPPPFSPEENSQFENWEKGVIDWAKTNLPNFSSYNLPLPPGLVSFENSAILEDIIIENVSPKNGDFVQRPFVFGADIKSTKGLSKIEFYLNRSLLQTLFVSGKFYHYQNFLNNPLNPQNLIEFRVTNVAQEELRVSVLFFYKQN
ncbi:MAG: transglycosylase domain-containing protein [Patescibacteria group bacterium]